MSGATPVYDLIDDLHYSYAPGANPAANAFSSKLQGVDDVVTDAAAQPRGVFLPSSGYGYDGNGNMIGAGSVTAEYNILNLPTKLSTSNGDRKFEYVFGGGKYSAQLNTGNPAIDEMRHYIGGMEFKNDTLEAYNFGDGRVVFHDTLPTPRFQYRLHDHLGNTVVFFEDKNADGCIKTEDQATSQADLEIIQRLLYYPFGMALEGLGAWSAQPWQQYRYNGKERDTLTGWYDYGARWGLLDIGRWNAVDPLAGKYPGISPFVYVANSPILLIDPDGREIVIANGGEVEKYVYGNIYQGTNTFIANVYKQLDYLIENPPIKENIVLTLASDTKFTWQINYQPWENLEKPIGEKSIIDGIITIGNTGMERAHTYFNDLIGYYTQDGGVQSPVTTLYHEAGHAAIYQLYHQLSNRGDIDAALEMLYEFQDPSPGFLNKEEKHINDMYEVPLAKQRGEGVRNSDYGAKKFKTTGPFSTDPAKKE